MTRDHIRRWHHKDGHDAAPVLTQVRVESGERQVDSCACGGQCTQQLRPEARLL